MTTIRRNWTKRVAEIRTAARTCRVYDSDSGNMLPVDPARAFEAWERTPRARLTEDTPGRKWTVHVHSNRFYVLTAEEPSPAAGAAATAEEPAAAPAPPQAVGPATAQHRNAADLPARHTRAPGGPDRVGPLGQMTSLAVELVGKTIRVKLAQGFSHQQIREEFEGERTRAEAAGDAAKARGLETMLAVHAATTTQCAPAQAPTGPARRALPAPPPGSPTPADLTDIWDREQRGRRPGPRPVRMEPDTVLSRIDSVLHDAAVTGDPAVSADAMRSAPMPDRRQIIHHYSRAQALADGVLIAADASAAQEAGFRVPVALTSAVWEDCVAWSEADSDRQVPQDESGRLWDVLFMSRSAIRRGGRGGDRVTVDLRRVPRDGRSHEARRVQLLCAIARGDHGEPVITIMQPGED
ncbi:DUF6573 family protein [Streptomyces antibioticus]